MQKHIITIGIFDKDSHKQEIKKPKVVETVINTINNYGFCATILTEGIYGIYQHDDGSKVIEPSIRVEIAGEMSFKILPLIHDLGSALNQESIMWETTNDPIEFTHIEYK